MTGPGMMVTGATGFLGRHVLEAFAGDRRIWALSRSSPTLRGVSLPGSVRWLPVDISDRRALDAAVESISREGTVDTVIHLAGHYDFTGEQHEDYVATNVVGTRNVCEAARALRVRDVVFSSSVAACQFPAAGAALDEGSPPDGDTPYASSKRDGEAILEEYRADFRVWTVRFAALFSDWCEYEPLFRFLESWLSGTAPGRVVAGKGLSAVPYLHIRDAMVFLRCLLARRERLESRRVLLASPSGATTHRELFEAATSAQFGRRSHPLFVPGPLCRSGLRVREIVGGAVGLHAFERPWMGLMIDKQLRVDSGETQDRLGWAPRPRMGIIRRVPFLVENRKSHPAEWLRKNHGALRTARPSGQPGIWAFLSRRQDRLVEALVEYVCGSERAERFPRLRESRREGLVSDATLLVGELLASVRTGDKTTFARHCTDLAIRRAGEGVAHAEWTAALDVLHDLCVLWLLEHDAKPAWSRDVYDHVTMTVQFGVDAILEVLEREERQPVP